MVALHLNDGQSSFTEHVIDSDCSGCYGVHAADLDGDSDVDALSASAAARNS